MLESLPVLQLQSLRASQTSSNSIPHCKEKHSSNLSLASVISRPAQLAQSPLLPCERLFSEDVGQTGCSLLQKAMTQGNHMLSSLKVNLTPKAKTKAHIWTRGQQHKTNTVLKILAPTSV